MDDGKKICVGIYRENDGKIDYEIIGSFDAPCNDPDSNKFFMTGIFPIVRTKIKGGTIMKKIPTLFHREFEGHKVALIDSAVTPGMEWVLNGDGYATVKWDGSCCAIIGGELYRRFDAKAGRKVPAGAIPCCDPDPVTGHWPHWVKCSNRNPSDIWFFSAMIRSCGDSERLADGTYEAIGRHFNGNPYGLDFDIMVPHGVDHICDFPRSFEGIREYLRAHNIEGVVFWKDGEPRCKIKRSDFGFEWPARSAAL